MRSTSHARHRDWFLATLFFVCTDYVRLKNEGKRSKVPHSTVMLPELVKSAMRATVVSYSLVTPSIVRFKQTVWGSLFETVDVELEA